MNRKLIIFFMIVQAMFLLTGCWDSIELNDRAIELAWGIDKAKNKKIQISTQVVIPSIMKGGDSGSGGGSQGKAYYVESGTGKDTLDAVQHMQTKLSRKIFRGQRRIIVIGEELARSGIKDILDTYSRDPSINLLTDIFVIKGDTAKDFLQTSHPLEMIPAVGALKEYYQIGSLKEVGFLNFLLFASSEASCPTMAAIGPISSSLKRKEGGFQIAGTGIFNKDLKLIGYLNLEEGKALRWATGNLEFLTITSRLPNTKGYVSIDLNKMDSKIRPIINKNQVKFLVTLKGRGAIRENNTALDLTKVQNLAIIQKSLEDHAEKYVSKTITKVQKEYGTDIFGFSDALKRKDLRLWKSLSKDWNKQFSEVEVSVKANISVRKIGVTGKSLVE